MTRPCMTPPPCKLMGALERMLSHTTRGPVGLHPEPTAQAQTLHQALERRTAVAHRFVRVSRQRAAFDAWRLFTSHSRRLRANRVQ